MSESRIDAISSKKLRLKVSHYRPGHALKVPGVEAFRIPRQSLHDGGKNYAPGAFIPSRDVSNTHFCWRMSRPQRHIAVGMIKSMKNMLCQLVMLFCI
jgi:hypothetical protein